MKLDAEEKELLESVKRGEWKSAGGGKRERTRYSRYATATFRKDRRLNIRRSSKDLEAIQKRALAEGLPYQTLIAVCCTSTRPGASKRSELRAREHKLRQFKPSFRRTASTSGRPPDGLRSAVRAKSARIAAKRSRPCAVFAA
jgi:predicted DNA binding CopG/RHH family protein